MRITLRAADSFVNYTETVLRIVFVIYNDLPPLLSNVRGKNITLNIYLVHVIHLNDIRGMADSSLLYFILK